MFACLVAGYRDKERTLNASQYDTARKAAEVQRQVRHYAQSIIKPGIKLTDMCDEIENMNRKLVQENGLEVSSRYTSTSTGTGGFDTIQYRHEETATYRCIEPSLHHTGWHCFPYWLLY